MANSNIIFNTEAIRNSARQIERCNESVQSNLQSRFPGLISRLENAAESDGEIAIEEKLEEISEELRKIIRHLSGVSESMRSYADKLDEADAKLKELIGNR